MRIFKTIMPPLISLFKFINFGCQGTQRIDYIFGRMIDIFI